ncbi:MAG: type II secretion system protein [Lentisphaeria bacterium]|nr:type II secretion system protein [Lentisphaeria bacterium]
MKKQAFTMTEMLVVMAIIMILAGLVFPAVSSSRTTARAAACLSNQKQVITAIISCMNASKNSLYSRE